MRRFIPRRLLSAPVVLLGVLSITFALLHVAPGEPFARERSPGAGPESTRHLQRVFATDDPLPVRFARWIGGALQGDLGVSFTYRRPVTQVLGAALPPTILLTSTALLAAILLGFVAACGAAMIRGPWADRALSAAGVIVYSAPSFWIGILLVQWLAVRLGLLPVSGLSSTGEGDHSLASSAADLARHLLLPCLTLALPAAAAIALHMRASMRDLEDAPFVLAARARGTSRPRIVLIHLARQASTSTVTLLGLALPELVGGSLVVEVLFAWPGMGRITYEAILARDLPVAAGAVLLAATMSFIGSLGADLLNATLDPRVTRGDTRGDEASA